MTFGDEGLWIGPERFLTVDHVREDENVDALWKEILFAIRHDFGVFRHLPSDRGDAGIETKSLLDDGDGVFEFLELFLRWVHLIAQMLSHFFEDLSLSLWMFGEEVKSPRHSHTRRIVSLELRFPTRSVLPFDRHDKHQKDQERERSRESSREEGRGP